ncbi:hypothetical protein FOCC_FOCC016069 [Frankliniella occidentalis]|nr:hypothetical protein FOCC_FOCC016069 [Frankliniella occidentalis]
MPTTKRKLKTLTGHGTFHNMGGIQCTAPKSANQTIIKIPRMKGKLAVDVSKGRAPILPYAKAANVGLKTLTLEHVNVQRMTNAMLKAIRKDLVWISGCCLPSRLDRPLTAILGYSGFMEIAHTLSGPCDVSGVDVLPFINLDPTDRSCVYSALRFALLQCDEQRQKSCIATLDLPLYMKAVDITLTSEELENVIVILGGFHMAMSFLGCIGAVYAGSGLDDLFSTVYAKNSVPHIMGGHAYAGSVRANGLAQHAIGKLILQEIITANPGLGDEIALLYEEIMQKNQPLENLLNSSALDSLLNLFTEKCAQLSEKDRTSKLWVEYFRMMEVFRLFTQSLRTGDWELYLDSMRAMLPYFHAANHFPYAKGTHIYLQQMDRLETMMDPMDFEMYTKRGFFVVRHTDRFFKCVPMDYTIETKLMRHLKTCGLTRGRGKARLHMRDMEEKGGNFAELKLTKKNKVKSFATMSHNITLGGEEVTINPYQLLHRIVCALDADNGKLVDFLEYELALRPPSLFDEVSMRKTEKAALAAKCPPGDDVPHGAKFVVDGGMLLRAIVWPRPATHSEVCLAYRDHAVKRYKSDATIVFDGYEGAEMSTKAEEQRRRSAGKTSPKILNLQPHQYTCTAQANFLGNGENKTSLIRMMTPSFESAGMTVIQDEGDADQLVVETALRLASSGSTVVVSANGTDIFAMLIQTCPVRSKVHLLMPGVGGKASKVFNIKDVQKSLLGIREAMLLTHAFSGGDTTSAFYGKGKSSLLGLLEKNPEMLQEVMLFHQPNGDEKRLVELGEKIIINMYNGAKRENLKDVRYALYVKKVNNKNSKKEMKLKTLPPTSPSAREHTLRVYHQVQSWYGRKLDPTKFGWEKKSTD